MTESISTTPEREREARDAIEAKAEGEAQRAAQEQKAKEEAEVIIFEPSDVVNTCDAPTSDYTAPGGEMA